MYGKVTSQFSQCETLGMRHSKLQLGQTFFELLSPYFFFTGVFYVIGPNSQHVTASSTVILTGTFVV